MSILSFDVGTTAMKCILYSESFEELKIINKEYSLETNGDFVRLNADVYFDSFCSCVKEILNSGFKKEDIKATNDVIFQYNNLFNKFSENY